MKNGWIKVAAATPEIRVADCRYNAQQCLELIARAGEQGVKVLVFPELCLTGSTCGDLLRYDTLLQGAEQALQEILQGTADADMLIAVGLPVRGDWDNKVYNCAAVLHRGKIKGLIPKSWVTGEEKRWFASGAGLDTTLRLCGQSVNLSPRGSFACQSVPGLVVGVEVGEDLFAPVPGAAQLCLRGVTVMLHLSAQPEIVEQTQYRRKMVESQSQRLVCAYVCAGAGEGESTTDVVHAGHRMVAENGRLLAEGRFDTGLTVSEVDVELLRAQRRRDPLFAAAQGEEEVWRTAFDLKVEPTALTRAYEESPFVPADPEQRTQRWEEILTVAALGLKKRLRHAWAKTAVVGLSGGLDSTLALLITARAMEMLDRPMGDIVAITMPCFGTTSRTKSNAEMLAERVGATLRVVDIGQAVKVHFADIGQSMDDLSVTFENAQARERTQVLMDVANQTGGLVIGTGDLSELALGWATYNGDHMSMYGVNGGIPKTLVRHLVAYEADRVEQKDGKLAAVLRDILATPVSPELLPPKEGEISQITEDLVGPYELHDFFLYYILRWGFAPGKVLQLAQHVLGGRYDRETLLKWLHNFYRRFFIQQFKRSCLPDGPKVGSVSLSPRGDWKMPSDAVSALWMEELEGLK